MSDEGYAVPRGRHRTEEVLERSRFITTLDRAATVDDARAFVAAMREEFADATHNCWAFVAGPPGSTAVIGMSDAGEPHGTAGRPMLDVLLHAGVGEIVAVVTRYYGGVKLGKGGLVRAYGGCVLNALATLPRVQRVERALLRIAFGYADVEALRRLLAENEAELLDEQYGEAVTYTAAVPVSRRAALAAAVADATAGRARIEEAGGGG